MTTSLPFSADKEKPKMPTKENNWGKYVTPGLMLCSIGGGLPYIDSLQEKLAATRESNIRLEVKVENLSEEVRSIKATLDMIRNRLEAKGIVNQVGLNESGYAGQNNHSK